MKQDNFEDIDVEAKLITAAKKPGVDEGRIYEHPSIPELTSHKSNIEQTYIKPESSMNVESPRRRGLWVSALDHFLDPNQKTLVWDASSIDGVGSSKK